jgi:hypothetical protein
MKQPSHEEVPGEKIVDEIVYFVPHDFDFF